MSETKDIKVPIKRIILDAVEENGCEYDEYLVLLLRMYFIACLNLDFIDLDDLEAFVAKFTQTIKAMEIIDNSQTQRKLCNHIVMNNRLTILNGDQPEHAIEFFAAVTEVLFQSKGKENGAAFRATIAETVAEKIENMQIFQSRIIIPKTETEFIGENAIILRGGYQRLNLMITLLKQFFMMMNYNENIIIRRAFYEGIDTVFDKATEEENAKLLMDALDSIYNLYIDRIENDKCTANEIKLIEHY